MKTREFNIENYNVEDIIKNEVVSKAKAYCELFTHEFLETDTKSIFRFETYYSKFKHFDNMTKSEQDMITELAKKQYEERKAQTIKDWDELKSKCDHIFSDDKQYKKLLPELDCLYYCQAISSLKDFYHKKLNSKSLANSKYMVRALHYSEVSCD